MMQTIKRFSHWEDTTMSDNKKFQTYCVRITLDERRDWERAAASLASARGKPVSLAKWIRIVLNAEVEDRLFDDLDPESEGFKL